MTRYAYLFLTLFLASVLYIGMHIASAHIPTLEPVTAHYYDPKTGDHWEVIEYVEKEGRK